MRQSLSKYMTRISQKSCVNYLAKRRWERRLPKIGSLRILNIFSVVPLVGGEVCKGFFPGAAIELVRTCPASELIVSCLSIQPVLAGASKQDIVSAAAFDHIIAAFTADQVIAAISVDAIPVLGSDDDIIAVSSLQLSFVLLTVIRSTHNLTPGVHINRGCLPVAHWGIWHCGQTIH